MSEERLLKIDELIGKIKELDKNQVPREILGLHNIKSTRIQDKERFKNLYRKEEMQKFILNKYKENLLDKANLTG